MVTAGKQDVAHRLNLGSSVAHSRGVSHSCGYCVAVPSETKPRWKLPLRRANTAFAPPAYRMLVRIIRPPMSWLTRRHWDDGGRVPADGGALVVSNHLSNYDTLAIGEYLIYHGRWPRYLGKEEIWKVPVVRWFAKQCRQIPVKRNTPQAKDALVHAKEALEQGDLVAMYPEGTITRDPDGWPMTGRQGAARLALETGVPVIPVAVVGSDLVLGRTKLRFPRFGRRRIDVHVLTGEPVDLGDLAGDGELTRDQLEAATTRIMDALTALVATMRGEDAPVGRWDMRVGERVAQFRQ